MATIGQEADLYRRHNDKKRCSCEKHCRAIRRDHPRVAATEDGAIEFQRRNRQYRTGDYT